MMTIQDVRKEYDLDSRDRVKSPGKFEHEHWTTVAMYQLMLGGGGDEQLDWSEDEIEDIFILDDELRAALDVGPGEYAYSLCSDSQGFVYGGTIDLDTYNSRIERYESTVEERDSEELED